MKFKVKAKTLKRLMEWEFDPEYELEIEGEPIKSGEIGRTIVHINCDGTDCKYPIKKKRIEKLDLPSADRNWESADIRDKINEIIDAINELRATPTNLE